MGAVTQNYGLDARAHAREQSARRVYIKSEVSFVSARPGAALTPTVTYVRGRDARRVSILLDLSDAIHVSLLRKSFFLLDSFKFERMPTKRT